MSGNGEHRPPRPRIELSGSGASPDEAAAIAAALERFLAENAAPVVPPETSRWQQAALREGVSRDPGRRAWGLR